MLATDADDGVVAGTVVGASVGQRQHSSGRGGRVVTSGVVTLGVVTLGVVTFGVVTLGVVTLGVVTLGVVTSGVVTLAWVL